MKFIEQGWQAYRRLVLPAVPPVQDEMLRQAFFAGAAILHTTILRALSPGPDETDADLQVMTDLQAEVDAFGLELDAKVLGSGRRQ